LFRTTWDYFDRLSEFLRWLDLVSQQTVLINSPILINWNLDKHYLLDLQAKGIQIPETHFISQGSLTTLKDLYDKLGWSETVLKPCVSGAGRHTYKLTVDNLDTYEPIFKKLIEKEAMMLQTFQHNVVKQGEISIMLFNGVYTHAVLKRAKQGDFRVQDDFGGSVEQYNPNQEEISFAIAAIKACPEVPLYARVDIFYSNDNKIALGEFELIEPELWFRLQPKAADLLARAIHKKLVTLET
jgi:glutathione synthase/RimK-type ligase-like ATP-grasp enzyme